MEGSILEILVVFLLSPHWIVLIGKCGDIDTREEQEETRTRPIGNCESY